MNEIDREILIAVLAGEATPQEERRVAEWRAGAPEHEREFRRLARLWEATGDIDSGFDDSSVPSARRIVVMAQDRPGDREKPAGPRTSEPSPEGSGIGSGWRHVALAASLVLGMGIGALLAEKGGEQPLGPKALVTGIDEVATVTLEDETVVRLAPGSRLEFSGAHDEREVSLRGRAYFAVSRRPDDPFQVHFPSGTVEVLGTRFDVESRGEDVQVAVVEGEVSVGAEDDERVNIGANQVARAAGGETPEVSQVDDVYQVIDWLGRFLAFESTPMEQVAEELERRFGIQIRIADSVLRDRTVTGWFTDQAPEELMTSICKAVDARCTLRDGTVLMERPSADGQETSSEVRSVR